MRVPTKAPAQRTLEDSLRRRLPDTWLTCLKFLIPVYGVYYLVDRRTITPWITFLLMSIPLFLLSAATDAKLGLTPKTMGYNDGSTALAYLMSPITAGAGAMKAKRYARRRLSLLSMTKVQ